MYLCASFTADNVHVATSFPCTHFPGYINSVVLGVHVLYVQFCLSEHNEKQITQRQMMFSIMTELLWDIIIIQVIIYNIYDPDHWHMSSNQALLN